MKKVRDGRIQLFDSTMQDARCQLGLAGLAVSGFGFQVVLRYTMRWKFDDAAPGLTRELSTHDYRGTMHSANHTKATSRDIIRHSQPTHAVTKLVDIHLET